MCVRCVCARVCVPELFLWYPALRKVVLKSTTRARSTLIPIVHVKPRRAKFDACEMRSDEMKR